MDSMQSEEYLRTGKEPEHSELVSRANQSLRQQASDHPEPSDVHRALSAIGSWSDLDWDDATQELDRIRQASKPTPPFDLDA